MEEKKRKARVIAFYLPQFHPIPENDLWWGKGFTEWTNVAKAKPLFRGHYQPRIPADLGFYDLRLPEIREAQAAMAREAGIEGFMYWNYWMGGGKKLLEKPFEEMLRTKSPDFPFCVGWANHSWSTKTWTTNKVRKDSHKIEQKYLGAKDYEDYFYYLLPAFQDKRYITVDGKPFFLFFDFMSIPDFPVFVDTWRKLAQKNGLKGIHFVGKRYGLNMTCEHVLDQGLDSVYQLNTSEAEAAIIGNKYIKAFMNRYIKKTGIVVKYDFKKISENLYNESDKLENVFPVLIPQFDRTPRSNKNSTIYYGSTPEIFGKQVDNALSLIQHKTEEHKILLLKSWNEWGESNYIEPDLEYGHSYLDELKRRLT